MERLNVTHVHIKVSCGRVLSNTYKFAVRNRFHFLQWCRSCWCIDHDRLKLHHNFYFKSNHYLSTVATWWQNCHIAKGGSKLLYNDWLGYRNWFLHVLSLLPLLQGVLAKLPHFLNLNRFASNFQGLHLMIWGIISQKINCEKCQTWPPGGRTMKKWHKSPLLSYVSLTQP